MTQENEMTLEQAMAARKISLVVHLDTQYKPPLPLANRQLIMECFIDYWNGELDLFELQEQLREKAGYLPPIEEHRLYMYLDHKEFH